jgi:hypothetical protein
MDRTFREKIQDIVLNFLRYFVLVWMRKDAKTTFTLNDGFHFKRTEPYILLGNHAFLFDVIHIQKRFKITPYAVASQSLFAKQPTKFIFTKLLHSIPKSKGSSDIRAAKLIFKAIKKGYPVLIFPEGDTTFFGETNYIEESTYKLIKKLKVDVVTCTFKGGYLTRPRWATARRKKRQVHLDYNIAIKKDELQSMGVEEIGNRIKEFLYNNDYEYQRKNMIERPGKRLAEGFDNVAYICPECETPNTIVSHKNEIKCTHCNTVGSMNKYGFIEGFKYDNLVEWNQFQKSLSHKLLDTEFESDAILYHADYKVENKKRRKIGKVVIKYKNKTFELTGARNEVIPFDQIKNPILTLRRMFNFTYNDTSYIVKLESHVMSFLRVVQEKY